MKQGAERRTDRNASLTEQLWQLTSRPLDQADKARAVLHLVDWLGCAMAGSVTATGLLQRQASGAQPFAMAGPQGALAMGGLGSLMEMDDVHRTALLHPGPVVMPVVIAAPGKSDAETMLRAICGGYEAMVRLGATVGSGHYAFFHNTSTCGGLGSAVAASLMLGLNDDQAVWAMGHAMSMAGGVWQCRNEPGATKHLHVADAARRGLQGALFARAGLAGTRLILEGPKGFFAAMARDGQPDAVLGGSEDWRLHEVSFKPWPACRHAHPAIDAALAVRPALSGQTITATRIETFADAILFCDRPAPRTEAEAKFSLQHSVAVALRRGDPDLADFAPAALSDPDLANLRAITSVAATDAFTSVYPAHFGARITVETQGGATHAASVADAWGDRENPIAPEAVLAKYDRLTAWAAIRRADADRLKRAALDLANGASTFEFHAALTAVQLPLITP